MKYKSRSVPDRYDILASMDLGNVRWGLLGWVNVWVEEKKTVQKVCTKFAYKHKILMSSNISSKGSLHGALGATFMSTHQEVC